MSHNTPNDARPGPAAPRLRMLVALASYGNKNIELLKRVIAGYRAMDLDIDIVVLSEAPKDLGTDTEVLVGLPVPNPWSLPFAHQPVFRSRMSDYDLFAYSEDDIAVTERQIRAFVALTPHLATDEIAGFLRYELNPQGACSLPDVHSGYHWKPASAQRRGEHVVAEFSNEHAAFYLLTRAQLSQMVAQDGFVRSPCEGRYDMLCTAATLPYTAYRYRKVICLSALPDFLVHHLSNRYAGSMGVPLATLQAQADTLIEMARGTRPAITLFESGSRWPQGAWAKNCYEQPDPGLLSLIPSDAASVLSVGCGWGATEALLMQQRKLEVTAVPVDAVFGAALAERGIRVAYGSLDDRLAALDHRLFDCVLLTDFLHLLPNPAAVVADCARFVRPGGVLVIGGPNFGSLRVLAKRLLNRGSYRKLRSFDEGGINVVQPSDIGRTLRPLGFELRRPRWPNQPPIGPWEGRLGRWGSANWLLQARRQPLPAAARQSRSQAPGNTRLV